MSKKAKLGFGIFLLSFLPYLYVVYASIFGLEWGFFSNTEHLYGWEAVTIAVLLWSVVPVYPIALLFQCIYGFVNRKKFTKKQTYITGIIVVALVGVTLLGCIGHFVREQLTIRINYKQHKAVIEAYLYESYGEALSADMEIQMPNKITRVYYVNTPLLEFPFSVSLHDDKNEVFLASFEEDYIKETNLNEKMSEHLSQQWGLPEHAKLNIRVKDIDVKGYKKEELSEVLLSNCDYRIDGLTMDYSIYLEENVVREIKHFLLQWEVQGKGKNDNRYFMFYVRVNDENYASIQGIPSVENDKMWTLHFSGYTDAKGTTIEHKLVDIYLE